LPPASSRPSVGCVLPSRRLVLMPTYSAAWLSPCSHTDRDPPRGLKPKSPRTIPPARRGGELGLVQLDQVLGLSARAVQGGVEPFSRADVQAGDDVADVEPRRGPHGPAPSKIDGFATSTHRTLEYGSYVKRSVRRDPPTASLANRCAYSFSREGIKSIGLGHSGIVGLGHSG
jgi:hypothetical protein